jgi:arylsulfatase
MKMTASHFGGTRNGLVVSWPGRTSQPQVVRGQFGHVNDVAPTILAAAGIPFPSSVDGVAQIPFEGVSMIPTFTNPKAPETHRTQYFDIFGNRAIYQDGWVAAAKRFEPWAFGQSFTKAFDGDFSRDKWELYNVREDFAEANDLAAKYPDKLKALQAVFDSEAKRNMVYPLAPKPFVNVPHIADRNQTHFDYLWGVDRIPLNAMPPLSGRAHKITVEIEAPANPSGVILAWGGRYGGFTIYVKDGKLIYENGSLGLVHEKVISTRPLPVGKVTIATSFTPEARADGKSVVADARPAGAAQSGTARLFINGQQVAAAKFSHFGDFGTAINETFDLGRDNGSPVSPDYTEPNAFNGRVNKASFDLGK